MKMLVNSMKLGQIEVPRDKIIHMAKPILGFEHLKDFCLIEVEELKPFLWLQSIEDSAVSFLLANPKLIHPDYKIEINIKEVAELEIKKTDNVETYVILTFHDDPSMMSANLQGPIVINTQNNLAKQLILVNSDYPVNFSLFENEEEFSDRNDKVERVVEV